MIASIVSTDDGYASAKGRDKLLELGVKTISISGAKGKKLTASEDWDSEEYKDARRCRSAVESLMFTIKDGFAFGELGRRGIKAVRDELLEKVLAYNCCRTILIRKRRQDALERAARNAADITTKTTLTALRCQKLASDWTHRAPAARRRHDNRRASAIHS